MRNPGWNHLDRRPAAAPLPRDYCTDAWSFGHRGDVSFRVPPGGNVVDLEIARLQHELILEWRRRGGQPSTSQLRARYQISKQTFSRVARGERFLGERVQAALLLAWQLHQPSTRPPQPS